MQKQKAYDDRQRAKGYKVVRIWVPADKVDQVKRYAERLRKEAEKRGRETAVKRAPIRRQPDRHPSHNQLTRS